MQRLAFSATRDTVLPNVGVSNDETNSPLASAREDVRGCGARLRQSLGFLRSENVYEQPTLKLALHVVGWQTHKRYWNQAFQFHGHTQCPETTYTNNLKHYLFI